MEEIPKEIEALVERARIPRSRATDKLRNVLKLAAEGRDPLSIVRTISVLGSYARGAPSVGDIDLVFEVDDPRDPRRAGLEDYYAGLSGRNPYGALLRALRCSGTSMVSAVIVQRHREEAVPVAPEKWTPDMGEGFELASPPELGHIVTNEPLAGPSVLLFVRGDGFEAAVRRLSGIPEDSSADRFDRTTGVGLLDVLGDQMGVEVQYKLARLVRGGGLALVPHVLRRVESVPRSVARFESRSWGSSLPGGRSRRDAVMAAVQHLEDDGVKPSRVEVGSVPLAGEVRSADVLVDWGIMTLYRAGEFLARRDYTRILFVLRAHRKGPWVALDVGVSDVRALKREEQREHAETVRCLNTAFVERKA